MSLSKTDKDVRSCVWSTISYLDSSSIIDISQALNSHFIPAVISPLHCKDVNDDGSPKKPHYHILLLFKNQKSRSQIREFFVDGLGCVGAEKIFSKQGAFEYLWHANELSPNKPLYDKSQLRFFNCCEYDFYDSEELLLHILNNIYETHKKSLSSVLWEYENNINRKYYLKVIKSNAYLINTALRENRQSDFDMRSSKFVKIDDDIDL